jgi:hypothetical protein
MRLRYVLPAVQVVIALALYYWSDRWFAWAMHVYDMPGPSPAFTLLVCLNPPAALLRASYFRHVPELWDRAIFIPSIGLLWYWVARNIESWRSRHTPFTFSRRVPRLLLDLLLLALAVYCGFWALSELGYLNFPWSFSWSHWLSFLLLLLWSASLIFFFGRDFVLCARRNRQTE